MKITNLGVGGTSLPSPAQLEEIAAHGDSAVQGSAANAQGYSPSPELLQLIHLAREQPATREERVQATTQRLQRGFYNTPASAEQTAAAMLSALD